MGMVPVRLYGDTPGSTWISPPSDTGSPNPEWHQATHDFAVCWAALKARTSQFMVQPMEVDWGRQESCASDLDQANNGCETLINMLEVQSRQIAALEETVIDLKKAMQKSLPL